MLLVWITASRISLDNVALRFWGNVILNSGLLDFMYSEENCEEGLKKMSLAPAPVWNVSP